MYRRIIAAVAGAILLAAGPSEPFVDTQFDENGEVTVVGSQDCRDIESGTGSYTRDRNPDVRDVTGTIDEAIQDTGLEPGGALDDLTKQDSGSGSVTLELYAASCPWVKYTVDVYASRGGALLTTESRNGAERTEKIELTFDVGDHLSDCVYIVATTSHGRDLYDRAPDSGWAALCDGGSPATSMR